MLKLKGLLVSINKYSTKSPKILELFNQGFPGETDLIDFQYTALHLL